MKNGMRVLLLGEFSGLYKNLKEGLEKNEIEVMWYASQDGFKQIKGMDRDVCGHTGVKIYDKFIYPLLLVLNMPKVDVIQMVHPLIFSPYINFFLIKILKKKTNILCLSASGTDYAVYQYGKLNKNPYGYYILDDSSEYDELYGKYGKYIKNEEKILDLCDSIMPSNTEYAMAYEGNHKRRNTICLPINIEKINYSENVVREKIVFFHGLNREVFKGTKYIREAMERLKRNYPEEVDIIIDGHMPLDRYLNIMQSTNVVIDQCKSYSIGINALYAMAQGKIVLGGAEDLSIVGLDKSEYPVWNIEPNSNQIYEVLETIVRNKEKIPEWGRISRQFVEKHYDCKNVAKEYIETWKTIINEREHS